MSCWIRLRLSLLATATLSGFLVAGHAQEALNQTASTNADSRYIVDDETYEKNASKEVDRFAMEACPQTHSRSVAFCDHWMVVLLEHSMIPMLLSSTW